MTEEKPRPQRVEPLKVSEMHGLPCYFCGVPMKIMEVYEKGLRIVHVGSRTNCGKPFPPKQRAPRLWPPAVPVATDEDDEEEAA